MMLLNRKKIKELVEQFGYENEEEMLIDSGFDSIVPGICMDENCDYTTDVEPDCEEGWCEICDTGTVKSCLVISNLI